MKAKDYIAGKQKPKRLPRKLVDRGKDLQDYLMSAHGFDRKVARQVVEQLDRVMPEKTTQAHRRQMLADIIADVKGIAAAEPAALEARNTLAQMRGARSNGPITLEQVKALGIPGPEHTQSVLEAFAAKLAQNGYEKESPQAADDRKYAHTSEVGDMAKLNEELDNIAVAFVDKLRSSGVDVSKLLETPGGDDDDA